MTQQRPSVEDVADIVQRLAVLLAAGVAPSAAWAYLAESLDDANTDSHPLSPVTVTVLGSSALTASRGGDVPGAIVSSIYGRRRRTRDQQAGQPLKRRNSRDAGGSAPQAKRRVGQRPAASASRLTIRSRGESMRSSAVATREAWTGFAAALQVATESGAPLAESLRQMAGTLRDIGQAQRDREAALAGPRATARTVLALPVVGILFGLGLGFDTVHVLTATAPGLGCLVAGAVLLAVAQFWNRALVRRATPTDALPGLAVDLVAIGMAGGASVPSALDRARRACSRFGLDGPRESSVRSVLQLADRAGVGTVELLRAESDQQRRDARGAAQAASSALGVRLMIPLAVCVLPAFMLLSVVPLVLSILSSTVSGL